ncbi:class I SAM-dependent methyltransferase [Desulfobacter latus]|uniref:Class I SAM-dependent methyltransferase n=1 Tax=Desulfobacter latus TaxID=2292 RepID=A0A850TCC1_9BACT|nr:class I SAM-dependent methyltransferase [Desulfobacter latus]NWH05036.1 class I SAM-dependent methyltransferase [Desulfobacter latus]
MKKWEFKALMQSILSYIPYGKELNRFLQKRITKRLILNDKRFQTKLKQCTDHISLSQKNSLIFKEPFTALELGTGWHPIVPIGLWLCGASHVYSVDIQPLISDREVQDTLKFFDRYAENGRLKILLPFAREEKIKKMREIINNCKGVIDVSVLGKFDIRVIVGDASNVFIPEDKIDFFVSNCVLEHIEPEMLKKIFKRFKRITSQNGIMCHLIDLADHYADFDGSIGVFNFLKFSNEEWTKYNNSFHYHNRLRVSDYRSIYEECGFSVVDEMNRRGNLDDISNLPIAKEFQSYSSDDLLVWRSRIVGTSSSR